MFANKRALTVHYNDTGHHAEWNEHNYQANIIPEQLTWHLMEILYTPQKDILKIRMNKNSYLDITFRILK